MEPGAPCPVCHAEHVGGHAPDRPVVLTSNDYMEVERLLGAAPDMHPAAAAAMRTKLAGAQVVFPGDVPADVVTLDSRVVYQIEDNGPETRTLVAKTDDSAAAPRSLPLSTPAGACLLGLAEGDRAYIPSQRGPVRSLKVLSLVYQPERSHRSFFGDVSAPAAEDIRPAVGAGNLLRFSRRRAAAAPAPGPDDDGHGPQAA
jgi:regulator of nucleoside diphosphate kinase